LGSAGVPGGTAQKNGMEIRVRKSGAGRVSLIVSRLPLTVMPEMCLVRPAS
jgi:hypothetical protein